MSADISKLVELAEQSSQENAELKQLITRLLGNIASQAGAGAGGGGNGGAGVVVNPNPPSDADIR